MSDRIKNGIVILVAVAWGVCVVVMPLVRTNYKADPAINVAFTAVVGFLFITSKDKEKK